MKTRLFLIAIVIIISLLIIVKASSQSDAIIELNSDNTWNWVGGSPTPHVITTTPGPTQTPWIITATANTQEPTPTQEDTRTPKPPTPTFIPSNTPIPTVTTTPESGCSVQNQNNYGVWVRTLPIVREDTNTFDAVLPDQYIRPKAIYYGPDYIWYQHWWDVSLVLGDEPQYVWSAANLFTIVSGCGNLPVIDDPFPTILQGAHIIGADGANVLLNYCQQMTTVKLFQDVVHYADDFRACNPDIWIVCRYWTDDIAADTDYNAQEAYDRIGDKFPDDCDAVEWENEKAPNNHRDWERLSAFSIDAARLMAANRNMQYCAFGLGPGWPDFDKLQYIIEYLKWVNENPLPDGRYHCVSSHAAMFAPWDRSDMPWVNDPYIAGRVYLIRDFIYNMTPDNFDLYDWKGVWAITEVGLSDGYSGSWLAPYTCNGLKEAYWETHRLYSEYDFPHAFQQWSYGSGGIWTNDSNCADAIWG